MDNISFHIIPYDDIWLRDSGPVYVFDKDDKWVQDYGYNAYGADAGDDINYDKDNKLPSAINGIVNAKYEDFNDYILERGNLESNGKDTVALNWDCQKARNPGWTKKKTEKLFRQVFGVTKVIWVEGHDPLDITTGHIDGILRFVNENTVAIAKRTNPEEATFPGEIAMLNSAVIAAKNAGFNVERINIPGDVTFNGELLPVFYKNYLVGNGFVLGMAFGNEEWDNEAKAKLKQLYPGRDVHMINTNILWNSGGGIHCVTNDKPLFK